MRMATHPRRTGGLDAFAARAAYFGERHRRVIAAACSVVIIAAALALLWPVLISPLAADQRFMYAEAAARTAGHWTRTFSIPWSEIPMRLDQGRFAPTGYIAQFVSYAGVTELATATSTAVAVVQGLQKILLLVLCLASIGCFAASLRGRADDGSLVRLPRRTLVLVLMASTLFIAVGAQVQFQKANGWTTYSVLTYGALIVDLLVVAVVLRLTRWLASSPSLKVVAVCILALAPVTALVLTTYELYYVAVPATWLALLLQPVAARGSRVGEWRAKALVGGGFTALFVTGMGLARHAVTQHCPGGDCYSGTTLSLNAHVAKTLAINLVSSIPLTGRREALHEAAKVGIDTSAPMFMAPLLVVVAAAGVALVLLARLAQPAHLPPAGSRGAPPAHSDAAARNAALAGACVLLVVAFGSALLMSLSDRSHKEINAVGLLYRHTFVTWAAVACALALVLAALGLHLRTPRAMMASVVAAVIAVAIGAVNLPYNLIATRAASVDPGARAVTLLYDELVLGDTSTAADDRRCAAVRGVRRELHGQGALVSRTLNGAYDEFRYQYGRTYCSKIAAPRRTPTSVVG